MIHSLKIYSIYNISINNIEVDYSTIPNDIHSLLDDFIKFFKIGRDEWMYGKNINSNDLITNFNDKKDDLLILSSKYGLIEVVKYLHQNGIDIHADNDWVLILAAGKGHLEVVKYLVEHGANIHADNNCALRFAAYNGYLEIFKYLLKNGADLMLGDDYSTFECATRNRQLEIVKYLVENIVNISFYVCEALYFAKKNNHKEVVEYL